MIDDSAEANSIICPHCGRTNFTVSDTCSVCNKPMKVNFVAINKVECPHCYTVIDSRAMVCPRCGKNARTKSVAYQVGSFLMAFCLLGILAGIFTELTIAILATFGFLIGWVIRRQAWHFIPSFEKSDV